MIDIFKTVAPKLLSVITKFIPDKTQQEAAQAEIMVTMANVMAEDAKSQDKFVRRARPTFLYVMYILLLVSIPCGILFVVNDELANKFIEGATTWFSSLPDALYNLLEVCFGVYGVGRSAEKIVKHWRNK